LNPLLATNNVAFSYQDTAIRTWLTEAAPAKKQEAAQVMRSLPDMIATWYLDGDHYVLDSSSTGTPMTASEREWFSAHAAEIVDTMAAPWAPDVVGLLSDDTRRCRWRRSRRSAGRARAARTARALSTGFRSLSRSVLRRGERGPPGRCAAARALGSGT
jgi:hypothetical protein